MSAPGNSMVVVDASVAGKWLVQDENHAAEAASLLTFHLDAELPIFAPPLIRSEVTNITRQRLRRQFVTRDEAFAFLDRFLGLSLTLVEPYALYRSALRLADDHGLPATDDAQYVVLADTLKCNLWTDDHCLRRLASTALPFVRWIGDFRLPDDRSTESP